MLRRRPVRALLTVVLTAMLGSLLQVGAPAAAAADLSQFNPGYIISDASYYNSNALSPQEVATFLTIKGAGCVPFSGGPPCLKDYRQTTADRAGDALCPGGYSGRTLEPASDIVWKVAQGCGISPAVLLVMLQKEQGLVTGTPYQSSYSSAMGQGCPDTAACDSYYTGFFNQVYGAASQLQRYRLNPTSYGYRAGLTNRILYHPNAACGASPVYIANAATAGLYNYTPYQPNAAALAAGFGTGDSCSAYGNRNFWNYYNSWFGPSVGPNAAPVGSLDGVSWSLTSPTSGTISVRGWAVDPDTTDSIKVHVYIDGQATPLLANASRPDVNAAQSTTGNHGFAATLPTTNGLHQVCVYAIDAGFGGTNTTLGCRTVGNRPPVGYVDSVTWNPSYTGTGSISVAGWALDPDSPGSTSGVALYVDNQGVPGTASRSRLDVNAALGVTGQHGFLATLGSGPGRHQVCVYATDPAGGPSTTLSCRIMTADAVPVGYLESASVANGVLTTLGWSIDPDTAAPIQVALYLDGAGIGVVRADGSRPDVSRVFPGAGDQHGFRTATPVTPGPHTVCAYGINSSGGANTTLGCQAFTA